MVQYLFGLITCVILISIALRDCKKKEINNVLFSSLLLGILGLKLTRSYYEDVSVMFAHFLREVISLFVINILLSAFLCGFLFLFDLFKKSGRSLFSTIRKTDLIMLVCMSLYFEPLPYLIFVQLTSLLSILMYMVLKRKNSYNPIVPWTGLMAFIFIPIVALELIFGMNFYDLFQSDIPL